ncbi:MAG: RNA polymerase sigma factor [Planctomycetes bacterium]|nr:RNA polymerase sigma factor [Planctomycetota bacterium]
MDAGERPDLGATWMLELQSGDASAFEKIVHEYKDFVHHVIFKFTGRREGVEDLAQEVFIRIYSARDRYRPDAKFRTWIFRIAYNLCVNTTKTRKIRRATSLESPVSNEGDESALRDVLVEPHSEAPLETMEKSETCQRLRDALATLPPQQRAAMTLYQYRGLSLREIADVLSTSEKAVKSLLARARENLREKMAPYLGRANRDEAGAAQHDEIIVTNENTP